MTNKCYDRLGEQVFTEKLENGLTVYVIPKKGYNKSYAFFAADYGGADRRFRYGGKWIDTPAGVAHFLEHKMFDTPDGGNALTALSSNGASPNAFTSTDITAYFFESTEKFDENLETLLGFVSVPYFKPESVQKEQGIIGQEIGMVEDDPFYAGYYGLLRALYAHNPMRDSVAGTVESIAEITSDTLYSCHSVFYNPSNMVLCVAGDVDPDQVTALARKILPKTPGEVPRRDYGETEALSPVDKKTETAMEVSSPIFFIGSKVTPGETGEERLRQELVGALALEILAGTSAPLYLNLYKDGLINANFSVSFETYSCGAYTLAVGESDEPDAVFKAYADRAQELADKGPDDALFEQLKKATLGRIIRSLNSFDNICYERAKGYFRGYDAYEAAGVLDTVTTADIRRFYKEFMVADNMALSVVRPKPTK